MMVIELVAGEGKGGIRVSKLGCGSDGICWRAEGLGGREFRVREYHFAWKAGVLTTGAFRCVLTPPEQADPQRNPRMTIAASDEKQVREAKRPRALEERQELVLQRLRPRRQISSVPNSASSFEESKYGTGASNPMTIPNIVLEGPDAERRLAHLGLKKSVLNDSLLHGYGYAASCTNNNPITLPGTMAWGFTIGALRDSLLADAWKVGRFNNFETVIHPSRAHAGGGDLGQRLRRRPFPLPALPFSEGRINGLGGYRQYADEPG